MALFISLKTTLSTKLSDWYSAFLFVRSREIEECLNCECDSFSSSRSYRGLLRSATCGRYSPNYLDYSDQILVSNEGRRDEFSGQKVYLRLKTDDSIHLSGIKISFIVKSSSGKILLRLNLLFLITDEFVKHESRETRGMGRGADVFLQLLFANKEYENKVHTSWPRGTRWVYMEPEYTGFNSYWPLR